MSQQWTQVFFAYRKRKKKDTNESTFLLITLANFNFVKFHTFPRIFIHLSILHHLWVLREQVSNWHVSVTLRPKMRTEWGNSLVDAGRLFSPFSIISTKCLYGPDNSELTSKNLRTISCYSRIISCGTTLQRSKKFWLRFVFTET